MENKISIKHRLFIWQMKVMNKLFGGYLNIGPVTIYGLNAMNWGVTVRTRFGAVCFRLPLPSFGRFQPLYFYISPNGTPWAATFIIGGGKAYKRDRMLAPIRRYRLGLKYDCWNDQEAQEELKRINNFI